MIETNIYILGVGKSTLHTFQSYYLPNTKQCAIHIKGS